MKEQSTFIQCFQLSLDDLETIIKEAVSKVLQEKKELLINNPKRNSSDYYLSRKEAAEFLKISETTLWSLDKKQILPAKRLYGKVLYLKSDLLNFHKQAA
ncbi:helix-turn-helix domain-containing protein [Tenacibaculum maritimum]|uniref:Helix-turn-helix domain-containing protein n=1 Tax=Tenacibaculum maritimum NCIMB 2154 TaxID=1349785 RepID=A0A2H1E677_9FLAO|nr:helix-turn-helix domain-containing protein [Tenacibaculum maritimum]SFZ80266.1 conserved protein of unknown function. Putative prophage regulator [Tenacibaculum maritimum NCIMB 2154]